MERLRDEVEVREVTGPIGVEYQVEIQGWWDGRSGGDLRIVVGADDGTLRGALVPVNRSS